MGDGQPVARHADTAQGSQARRRPWRSEAGRGRWRAEAGGRTDSAGEGGPGMTSEPIAFWGLSIVLVGSALAVVLSKNLFHAVLWLPLALTGTAGVFLLLDAEFLAAVQLLLYAGGIITIVVFAIVVTERLGGERLTQTNMRIGGGFAAAAVLLAVIVTVIRKRPLDMTRTDMNRGLTQAIGQAVLTPVVLPF